jgi:pimeloyl-ACP methyl ester carboxylesterase
MPRSATTAKISLFVRNLRGSSHFIIMPHRKQPLAALATIAKTAFITTIAAAGSWIGYSAFGIRHRLPLPSAIEAEQETFTSSMGGTLKVYADRSALGRPLVLIHSINAGASSFEMRPIFEHYRGSRPVYALDLPGFGLSERANRVYSPQLYKQAILDLLQTRVKEPADVIALSLGSEFAALAALERPDLFSSLTMISPSGFTRREEKRASQEANENGTSDRFYKLFAFPLWSQAFYDLLVTRTSIRYFLKQSFIGPVNPALEEYDYLATHQPGARYAPLYFVSGKLFTQDIRERAYEKLSIPVLVLRDEDGFVRFDTLPDVLARHDNWREVRIVPTKGLPQFEKLAETTQALDAFWQATRART